MDNNNDSIQRNFETKLEWILNKYQVDNDNTFKTELEFTVCLTIRTVYQVYQSEYSNIPNNRERIVVLFRSVY